MGVMRVLLWLLEATCYNPTSYPESSLRPLAQLTMKPEIMSVPDRDDAPWYQDGLSFECTRCGACCTGAPGYVWVDQDQMLRLAEFRGESFDSFTRAFVRRVDGRYSLIEHSNGDCVFWDRDVGCTVYPARPNQCRTWPFWLENVETPAEWERVGRSCPGSGQGRIYSPEEIRAAIAATPD